MKTYSILFYIAITTLFTMVGCKESSQAGPTKAERAQLYLAAKAALDEVEQDENRMKDLVRRARESSNGELPEDVQAAYLESLESYKIRRDAAEKMMRENDPLKP